MASLSSKLDWAPLMTCEAFLVPEVCSLIQSILQLEVVLSLTFAVPGQTPKAALVMDQIFHRSERYVALLPLLFTAACVACKRTAAVMLYCSAAMPLLVRECNKHHPSLLCIPMGRLINSNSAQAGWKACAMP